MKGLLALAILSFLIFGCIQFNTPAAPTTGSGIDSLPKANTFSTIHNNTTSAAYAPYASMSQHSFQVTYAGNWTDFYANVSLQGSIDNTHYTELGSVAGNTSALTFVNDKLVTAVRVVVTGYNASTNASIANITVRYVGTG